MVLEWFDQPGESRLELSNGTGRGFNISLPPTLAVPGPWQLSVSAAQAVSPQAPLSLQLERLVSWRTLPELRHYAGSATYTTEIVVPPECLASNVAWQLDLGGVFELARVTINDRDAGTAWRHPFRVDATGLLKTGRNSLRIEVPNLLKNHLEKGDSSKPQIRAFARSVDGGETWQLAQPELPMNRQAPEVTLMNPVNFAHPDFALRCFDSRYIISYDRGPTLTVTIRIPPPGIPACWATRMCSSAKANGGSTSRAAGTGKRAGKPESAWLWLMQSPDRSS